MRLAGVDRSLGADVVERAAQAGQHVLLDVHVDEADRPVARQQRGHRDETEGRHRGAAPGDGETVLQRPVRSGKFGIDEKNLARSRRVEKPGTIGVGSADIRDQSKDCERQPLSGGAAVRRRVGFRRAESASL